MQIGRTDISRLGLQPVPEASWESLQDYFCFLGTPSRTTTALPGLQPGFQDYKSGTVPLFVLPGAFQDYKKWYSTTFCSPGRPSRTTKSGTVPLFVVLEGFPAFSGSFPAGNSPHYNRAQAHRQRAFQDYKKWYSTTFCSPGSCSGTTPCSRRKHAGLALGFAGSSTARASGGC